MVCTSFDSSSYHRVHFNVLAVDDVFGIQRMNKKYQFSTTVVRLWFKTIGYIPPTHSKGS